MTGEEGKTHPVGRDEQGVIDDAANERSKFLELLVGECRCSKTNGIF